MPKTKPVEAPVEEEIMTPETETTTHYFWAVTRNFQLQDDAVGALLASENAAAFLEDKVVIEEQQRMIGIESPATPIMPFAAGTDGSRNRSQTITAWSSAKLIV